MVTRYKTGKGMQPPQHMELVSTFDKLSYLEFWPHRPTICLCLSLSQTIDPSNSWPDLSVLSNVRISRTMWLFKNPYRKI